MTNENKKSNAGRKWFDGKDEKEVISKCKEVWALGGTDAEASYYADISKDSISRYLKAHTELKEYRDRLRERPILKARQTIVADLGDTNTAKWFLERKIKDEFSIRTEQTGKDGKDLEIKVINYNGNNSTT